MTDTTRPEGMDEPQTAEQQAAPAAPSDPLAEAQREAA